MRSIRRALAFCFSVFVMHAVADTVHPDVEWSLAYQIQETECVKPRMRQSNEVAGQLERYERRLGHYMKCVEKYQAGLIQDHQRIFAAAEHGLSEQQALHFVETLKSIEAALQTLGEGLGIEHDYSDHLRVKLIGHRSSI